MHADLRKTAGGIRDTLPCAPQRIKGRSRREYRTHAHQRSIQRPCRRFHCSQFPKSQSSICSHFLNKSRNKH